MLTGIDKEIDKVRNMIDKPIGMVMLGLSNIMNENSPTNKKNGKSTI